MKKRNYADEYANYHSKPEQIANRSERNQARAKLEASGVDVRGKDVDHKKPLSKGGTNSLSNLRAQTPSENSSFARTKTGKVK